MRREQYEQPTGFAAIEAVEQIPDRLDETTGPRSEVRVDAGPLAVEDEQFLTGS